MKINPYITTPINQTIPLHLQILLSNILKDPHNQLNTHYLHIFKLQQHHNIFSITHGQEQPPYKFEYHYTN
ncbi:DUF960 family protein, partial [Staphylococcus epidermidis]|uniref:DUF960 family protein n=1 Tax=Staphylococcus epidermidis TaxID=1282 RepID=UPI001C935F14